MEEKQAKFQLEDMLGLGMTMVVLAIGLSYGLNVLADVRDDMTAGTAEYNATEDAITGVSKLPNKLPLIATIIVAAIVIGILVRYLAFKFR